MTVTFDENDLSEVAGLLKALSNERRLKIVHVLADKEKNVGELEKIIGLSQSALSQHLARLRRDGVVKTRRDAQTIYYSLDCESSIKVLDCLRQLSGTE